jgi:hypothetical protein
MVVLAKHSNGEIRTTVIYRPPFSRQYSSTESNFFNDVSAFAEQLATTPRNLEILGDLNFHLDDGCDVNAKKFHDMLESFNLKQHVDQCGNP